MKILKPKSYVTVAEISKEEIDLLDLAMCKQPKQSLMQYYNSAERRPDVLINAGFFALSTGQTCFNLVDDRSVQSSDRSYRWGIGITDQNEPIFGCMDNMTYRDFISAYPPLVEEGRESIITFAQEVNYKARRSLFGYNKTHIYLIVIDSPGMNFKEMQDLCLSLGIEYAINLDGGGSSSMVHNGVTITDTTNRQVDNVIAVYLKKEEPKKIIYRVQVGAFSKEQNAKNYLKEIQGLNSLIGIDYSKAYVRKINNLYKIQVGAFSVKENAVRLAEELKLKGYSAFITV